MNQATLTEASATPIGTDPFAAARARYPDARLVLLLDRRQGHAGDKYMLAVAPSSVWYELLPTEQIGEIWDDTTAAQAALLAEDPATTAVPS